MCIRTILTLGLIAIVPACGRVDSSGSAGSDVASVTEPREGATSDLRVKPAFYQADENQGDELDDLEAMDLETPDLEPFDLDAADREPVDSEAANDHGNIALALEAIDQLQDRMDQLHNQHRLILAALGIDDQYPASPPPAGSLARQVSELRETVDLLAVGSDAMRQAIEEQTVTLKPVQSGPADATLTVENNTDSDRQVWINGTSYWIWANSPLTVRVPPGQVITKVGNEEARTWEIPGPGQEVRIEIVRTSETVAESER